MNDIDGVLEQTDARFGYFSGSFLSDEQVMQRYNNVCKQAAFAGNPANLQYLADIKRVVLSNFRVAEAQSFFSILRDGTDRFAEDRRRACQSAANVLTIVDYFTGFWQN